MQHLNVKYSCQGNKFWQKGVKISATFSVFAPESTDYNFSAIGLNTEGMYTAIGECERESRVYVSEM